MFHDTLRHQHQTQWVHLTVTGGQLGPALELLLEVDLERIKPHIHELLGIWGVAYEVEGPRPRP